MHDFRTRKFICTFKEVCIKDVYFTTTSRFRDEKRKGETLNRNNLGVIDISGSGGGGRKLVGWLQVRDPKNKKSFLQVVDPAPKGPFRKAPWHNGNFHVLKL